MDSLNPRKEENSASGLINGVIMENFQNINTKNMKITIFGLIV